VSFAGVVLFRDGEETWSEDTSSAEDAARWLQSRAETGWTGIELDMDGASTGVLLRYFDPAGDSDSRKIRERIAQIHFGREPLPKISAEAGDRAARDLQRLAIRLGGGSTVTAEEAIAEMTRIGSELLEKK
jgi:hypothetical protein